MPAPQTLLKKLEYTLARAILKLPDSMLYALSGGKSRTNQAGHRLDARIQMALRLDRLKPDIHTLPPQMARQQLRELVRIFDLDPEPLPRAENISVPGVARISTRIPMRLYAPTAQAKELPALVYYHGGGFVIGDTAGYDATMRYLSKKSGCIVISVDYRLAPDHPYPAAVDDALATYAWILKNGPLFGVDPKRVGVGGDSAGGNLALNICLQAASQRLKSPAFLAMIYPWVDVSDSAHEDESYRELGGEYALTLELLEYFTRHTFLSTQKLNDPAVSPVYTKAQQLKRVPPTLIQLCGFDPLRDQGQRMGDQLKAAGVECETRLYPTLIHGAMSLAGVVPDARTMLDEYAAAVAEFAFAGSSSAAATPAGTKKSPRQTKSGASARSTRTAK
ncbi:MAG: alpha/beta hydrolase [bacterium]|nr:alpha/beta hydrolase [bacterium]